MSSVNKVILVGRLGADPELRHTADNVPVATFRMATSESWKDKSGIRQEKTEWHSVVAWRKLAEISSTYLKKGKLVYVEGKLQTREYEGRDGVRRRIVEVVATDMRMIGGAGQGDRDDRTSPALADVTDGFVPEDDDVPL